MYQPGFRLEEIADWGITDSVAFCVVSVELRGGSPRGLAKLAEKQQKLWLLIEQPLTT